MYSIDTLSSDLSHLKVLIITTGTSPDLQQTPTLGNSLKKENPEL